MWLLQNEVRQALEAAIAAGVTPSADQQAQFEATHMTALSDGGSRIFKSAGNTAEIAITGVLTNKPDFMAMLFGGGNTTYVDIISAIGAAEQDASIEKIILAMDSPGGEIAGLFDLLDVIKATTKPIDTVVFNTAASAAYAIAVTTDSVIAKNSSARFGSVGIVVDMRIDETKVSIASTNAPNKRPDVTTEAGKAVVRAELDEVHDLFATAIADGRSVSVDKVNASFGQGGMFLAAEALNRGMIDSIAKPSLQSVTNTNSAKATAVKSGEQPKVQVMDLQKLKAEHPEAYLAAVNVGVVQERDRMTAHITMGEASGDMKTAIASCKDGSEMTATLQATYMSAGMNRTDVDASAADEAAAAAAANAAGAEDDTADTDGEKIVAGLEERFGTEVK